MAARSRERLRQRFDEPPASCRSLPFWAWNDALQEEELIRQVRQMKDKGMGGFFIHSRDGLETEYMGREWMRLVRAAVETASELGMQAWLYDEDRWPSGFAGGLVQARGGDAFRAKGLTLEVVRDRNVTIPDDAAAAFKAVIDERNLLSCERLSTAADKSGESVRIPLEPNEVLLVFRVEISGRSEWFNNEAPPDQLNPDTVRAFIDITYEAYKREVGDYFGTTVRGVFTDEPSVHDRHCRFTDGRGWLPWSWSLPDDFRRRRGYELFDLIPYLFFDGELSPQARHDYWRTVTERFSEAYSMQIGRWCEENGLAFTGHYLWENNLGTATRVCGAVMPNYRYQHVPGIDMLNEQTGEYITVKQCTSVANQYGRPLVLTETYGCTGWGFTFEGQRWIGDFQFVLGVTLRSQHLALYSIRGCRKRDYPPVFNYNTSWWKYNGIVEDYFARLSAVLTEGKPIRDVLVLHPSSTAWCMVGTGPYGFPARGKDRDVSMTNRYGHEFNAFLGSLLRAHYDFDLGDETIMAETGEVRGSSIAVNLAEYRVVVLPPIRTMLTSTFRLLQDFLDAGGRAVAVGPPPALLEGRPSERLAELYGHPRMTVVGNTEQAVAALESILPRRVGIESGDAGQAEALLYLLKETELGRTLFVVNNDRDAAQQVTISLDGEGSVEEWTALTGEVKSVPCVCGDGRTRFRADFGPADSKLYIWTPERESPADGSVSADCGKEEDRTVDRTTELLTPSGFIRTMPNVLTLDRCRYAVAAGELSGEMDVWQAQRAVREALGMRQIYGNGIEQRYKWINEPHPGNGTPVRFHFTFHVEVVPERDVCLVVESAELYDIELNGAAVPSVPSGWFLDRSFDQVPLPPGGLKPGTNELTLSCRYHNRMEVEDVYLIGDFGVSPDRAITPEPEALEYGDWCLQGYPHYCGSMVYGFDVRTKRAEAAKTVLEVGEYSAVTAEVRVNGVTAGHIPWRSANGLDVTELLLPGDNRIEIEVMGSPRNMLGPFHHTGADPSTTSWASFRKEGADYSPEYKLRPYGLFEPVRLRTHRDGKGGG
ncbi:glycosyl hydrolase [Paenibacillus chartarius]|uniref:Glycosyl hydrolase n=1 Tax=Paenibacillus chartarius TaxID=747481 RepID=A0ABV6DDY6_9BACL